MGSLLLRFYLASCFLGLSVLGSAQTPAAAPSDPFAAEPFVIQHLNTVYTMHTDGTGIIEQTAAIKIQSESALHSMGVLLVPFASQSQHIEIIYARVRRPDGTVLETPPSEAIEEPAPVTREAPFYSDIKQKELPIKSLHLGDTLEWHTRVTRTVAEAPGQFWGQEKLAKGAVVLNESVELRVPAVMHVIVWANPADGKPAEESLEKDERVYHFAHSSLKPTIGAAAEAAKKAEEEHIKTAAEELEEQRGELPSVAWTTFPDWASVGEWYRKLAASRVVPDDTIKARVAELIAGKSTEREKAEAIYNYVSLQVRYIGVAFGIGRYQPHNAADVLANQYGDCKDKHTLLAAMLSAAGISSDAALIGAGIRFNEAVPSPGAFNHLITRAHIAGQDVWLDSTTEVAPFSMLVPPIRDKQALVIPAQAAPLIAVTPEQLPFDPFTKATVQGAFDKDLTSESHFVLSYRGDIELGLRAIIRQSSAANYGELIQRIMGSLGFGGTTSDPDIQNLQDTTKPLTFAFHYHRAKEESWGLNRITVAFIPIELPYVDEKKPPTASIDIGLPRTETSSVEMKLPEHWGVELPEPTHEKAPFATCDVTYRFSAGTFFAERRFVILKKNVEQKDWKSYKTWYDDCGASGVPYVQLIPATTTASGSTSQPVISVSNQKAAELIWQAHEAIAARDTDKALELLNQAKTLNPQQRDLWGTYGYRAYDLGMPTEAAEDYRKETVFHPDNVWVYSPLSEELYRVGKKDEALAAVRSGLAVDPANENLNAMLVYQLDAAGDTKGAIKAGNAALKLLPPDKPENSRFIQNLATIQIKAGDKAGAARNLAALLKVVTDSENQNNVAYALADLGLELPTAEASERAALDSLASQASAWTLEEDQRILKPKSALVVASWDTMGWVLFREGHIKEAHNYIAAAWHNAPDATIGLHLGDIELAENDPNAAFATYQLALATLPTLRGATPPAVTEMVEKLKAGIERAHSAGGKSTIKDWHAAAQTLRTIPLGPSEGRSGSAEYRILVAQGKAEIVHAIGHTVTGGDTLLLSTNFSDLTPRGEKGRVLVTGYLNCITATCELVIEP